MDAFEQVVSEILWMQGYWVRSSVKVDLTKEEKRSINRHSSPRWEIDIVGYKAAENVLRVVECKSYLDSVGVKASAFNGSKPDDAKRYKLFTEPGLREVVFRRLALQLTECGACLPNATIRLTLACGKIRNDSDREAIKAHFKTHDWDLWDEPWLRARLKEMATRGYENQTSAVVTKLLLRGASVEF
jgi:hypothetical protein